jgi:hypothetical protein
LDLDGALGAASSSLDQLTELMGQTTRDFGMIVDDIGPFAGIGRQIVQQQWFD